MPAQKVSIEVPEGMTPGRLLELVTTYEEKRVKSKARGDARKKAVNALKDAHKTEYDKLVASFMPKGG